jgi:prepilin-type processing-associated H-X9-DG protein
MQRWISVVVVLCLIILVIGLTMPAVEQSREAARQSTSKNNLKQIGLALLNYHDTHKCLPPGGVIREDDLALHGWFTMILPFCDQSSDYARLIFSEPWDQAKNRIVFEQPHPLFLIPGNFSRFTRQGYALTHYLGNPHLLYRNSNVTFEQMENGTAHTWLAGEVAGNFQPWGYPFNWRPLGTKLCEGPNSYGHPPWRGGNLLFADGSVTFFSENTSDVILKKFAAAPPVSTAEQTQVPDKTFETGDFYWKDQPLQSDPQAKQVYFVRVLHHQDSTPLRIEVYSDVNPEQVKDLMKLPGAVFLFLVDKTTDIAEAMKATSLSEEASPTQLQINEDILKNLQSRLPE